MTRDLDDGGGVRKWRGRGTTPKRDDEGGGFPGKKVGRRGNTGPRNGEGKTQATGQKRGGPREVGAPESRLPANRGEAGFGVFPARGGGGSGHSGEGEGGGERRAGERGGEGKGGGRAPRVEKKGGRKGGARPKGGRGGENEGLHHPWRKQNFQLIAIKRKRGGILGGGGEEPFNS